VSKFDWINIDFRQSIKKQPNLVDRQYI